MNTMSKTIAKIAAEFNCPVVFGGCSGPGMPHYNLMMDKKRILAAAKAELTKHSCDYFCTEIKSVAQGGNGVIVSGGPNCKKRFNTNTQYLEHLSNGVLPMILRHAFTIASETSP
jgi:hypothetical protein